MNLRWCFFSIVQKCFGDKVREGVFPQSAESDCNWTGSAWNSHALFFSRFQLAWTQLNSMRLGSSQLCFGRFLLRVWSKVLWHHLHATQTPQLRKMSTRRCTCCLVSGFLSDSGTTVGGFFVCVQPCPSLSGCKNGGFSWSRRSHDSFNCKMILVLSSLAFTRGVLVKLSVVLHRDSCSFGADWLRLIACWKSVFLNLHLGSFANFCQVVSEWLQSVLRQVASLQAIKSGHAFGVPTTCSTRSWKNAVQSPVFLVF